MIDSVEIFGVILWNWGVAEVEMQAYYGTPLSGEGTLEEAAARRELASNDSATDQQQNSRSFSQMRKAAKGFNEAATDQSRPH